MVTGQEHRENYQTSQDRSNYLEKKLQKKLNTPKPYDKPKEAMQYYVDQRKPIGATNIPVQLYQTARQQMNDMPRLNSSQNLLLPSINESSLPNALANEKTSANFSNWNSLGPGNVGGRTRTLAINPSSPDTMYTAGVAGGIWKTTNGGSSWSPLNDLMNNMAVTTIIIDPNNHDTLYAGTGEGFFNIDAVRGDGIFKSTDAGLTWTHLDTTSNNPDFHYVNKLAINSHNPNQVYTATRAGVFRSIDGGASWVKTLASNNIHDVGCLDLQIRTDNPNVLITSCGSFYQSTVYRSTDGGNSWSRVLTEPSMGRVSLTIAPSDQDVMYALSATNYSTPGNYRFGLHAVFKSTDSGATWVATVRNSDSNKLNTVLLTNVLYAYFNNCNGSSDIYINQGWYDNIIAVDPIDPNIVWAGGIDLFRSDDGGTNWGIASYWWTNNSSASYAHADQHGIYFHPDYDGSTNKTAFFSHDGGLSRTLDARASTQTNPCNAPASSGFEYTSLNNNYAVTQFYHGLAYPDGTTFFGGTQDNGTIRGTTSGGMIWSEILGGDGGYVAVDPDNTNNLFAESQYRNLVKSVNGGSNFNQAVSGISESTNNFSFITPYILDPNNPQILWIGGKTLWKTIDQANNWFQASTTDMLSRSASAWAVAIGDSNYVAVGDENGEIHYTTNANSTNSSTDWPSSQPANGVISSLTYAPNDKKVLYATYSTFGQDHIWKSTNSGASWTAIDNRGSANGIPDIPVHTLAIDPSDSTRLFAGTDLGIFVSNDGGSNWAVENTGFTNTVVENLQIIQSDSISTLFAFTHGRGAWSTTLATSTDTTPDAFSFTDQTDVERSTPITSNAITVSGINSAAAISVNNGEYRINNGSFTNTTGTVANGNTVQVRHTSSDSFSTTTDTVLTIGGVSDTFTSTTLAIDTTPDAFSFTGQTDVGRSTPITSNAITVSGINSTTAISVSSGGEYRINNGSFTNTTGTVTNGDTVQVRHTSSGSFSTTTDTVLTIGGVSNTFTSTTLAIDTTPDAFSFTDQTDVGRSTTITSNAITVSGINSAAAISVSNGEYRINNGNFTSTTGTVANGDTVQVRHTSSGSFSTTTDTVLTIGGVSNTFTSTTLAIDTTPDAFSFTDQTDVGRSTTITSNAITVSGINSAAAISVSNGEYRINNGNFTSTTGTVANGDTVQVRHTSSGSFSTTTDTVLTIGGVSDTFTSTTLPDTTPDAFSFTDQTDVERSTAITSNAITVSGINSAAAISVSNGEYRINNGDFTNITGTVANGDTVQVRHTSSDRYGTVGTLTDTILTIGGVSDTFTSTTLPDTDGDGSPDNQDTDPNDAGVAGIESSDGEKITIEAPGMTLSDVKTETEDSVNTTNKPDDYQVIGEILSYKINGISHGATVEITLTYPNALGSNSKIYKIDANGFTEFPNAVIAGNTVTLTLVDGGSGDADGVANGVIEDPVAVMESSNSTSDSSNGESGGGGSIDLLLLIMLLASVLTHYRWARLSQMKTASN